MWAGAPLRAAVGADLGGTKMAIGVVDSEQKVHFRSTERTYGRELEPLLDELESELREALDA